MSQERGSGAVSATASGRADAARAPSPAASAHRRTMLFFTYDLLLNDHTRGEYCRSPTRLSIAF